MLEESSRPADDAGLEREERQLAADYEVVFQSPPGRRVLCDLLERCHVFRSTYTGDHGSFFLEGERNIGLYLLTMTGLSGARGLAPLAEMARQGKEKEQGAGDDEGDAQ